MVTVKLGQEASLTFCRKNCLKSIKAEHGLPVTHKVDYVRYWKELPLEGKILTRETKDRNKRLVNGSLSLKNAYHDIIMLYYIDSMIFYSVFTIFCISNKNIFRKTFNTVHHIYGCTRTKYRLLLDKFSKEAWT